MKRINCERSRKAQDLGQPARMRVVGNARSLGVVKKPLASTGYTVIITKSLFGGRGIPVRCRIPGLENREAWGPGPPTKPNSYDPKSIETVTEFVVPYVTVNV